MGRLFTASRIVRLALALLLLGVSAFFQFALHRFWPWGWGIGGLLLIAAIPWERENKWGNW